MGAGDEPGRSGHGHRATRRPATSASPTAAFTAARSRTTPCPGHQVGADALPDLGVDDVMVSQSTAGGPYTITFVGNMAGRPACPCGDQRRPSAGAGVSTGVVTAGTQVFNTLANIQQAIFTGGASDNLFDASAWTGVVTLVGGSGDDTLVGGPGSDMIDGGAGNDVITGGGRQRRPDRRHRAEHARRVAERQLPLTDTTLTMTRRASIVGSESDTISGFQLARLTGGRVGEHPQRGGLHGDLDRVGVQYLNNGLGIRTTNGSSSDLHGSEAITQLSALNNGGRRPHGRRERPQDHPDRRLGRQRRPGRRRHPAQRRGPDHPGRPRPVVACSLAAAGTALVRRPTRRRGREPRDRSRATARRAAADLGLLGTGVGPDPDRHPDLRRRQRHPRHAHRRLHRRRRSQPPDDDPGRPRRDQRREPEADARPSSTARSASRTRPGGARHAQRHRRQRVARGGATSASLGTPTRGTTRPPRPVARDRERHVRRRRRATTR